MNHLRKKLQAIITSADFKGYLREVTGTDSVTLTDCMGSDMTSLSLVGNAVQDGTPSPDNPVEIQGCGDRTANLFDVSRHPGFDGNSITITNTSGANWQGRVFNIDYAVEFGKTYTYSVDYVIDNAADYSTIRFGYMTAKASSVMTIGDIITIHGSGTFVHTVTVPESIDNFDYFVLYVNSSGDNPAVGDKITISNIQIVEGSYTAETMPPYEPYGYKIPVEVSGINLFDVAQLPARPSGYVQEGEIYVTGYPYRTDITPEEFLIMTGLKEGDTFTTAADYEQVLQPPNPTSTGAQWIAFAKKPSAPADLSDVQFGTKGALKTITIPEGFNNDNYYGMCIYGGSGTPEAGQVRAVYRNLRVYKGTYTAATIPPYEPYHEPQTFNVYMDRPLYATGDVGDEITLDFEHKTATRTNKIRQLKDFEAASVVAVPPDTQLCINCRAMRLWDPDLFIPATPMLSNYFINGVFSNVSIESVATHTYPETDYQWYIYLNKTRIDMTADDTTATLATKCNAYIQTLTGREVYYQLLTPATTDISALQDWDTIPKLWRGTAIATVKTTVPTKAITARYYATKKED